MLSLEIQCQDLRPAADRFVASFHSQLKTLLDNAGVALGMPIESRIKTLESIAEKIERKQLQLINPLQLADFIGFRIVVIFRKDIDRVVGVLKGNFTVDDSEDVSTRLTESQFGYQSHHLSVRFPSEWCGAPTFKDLDLFRCEVQVRTLAQHIWAAASHKLQYKIEESVPTPVKRSINRVAALLETVDLEFERVLLERNEYVTRDLPVTEKDEKLNVDLLLSIITNFWPEKNMDANDLHGDLSNLLLDLSKNGITTKEHLNNLLIRHRKFALSLDAQAVNKRAGKLDVIGGNPDRIAKGVYFSHEGLTRVALRHELGKETEV